MMRARATLLVFFMLLSSNACARAQSSTVALVGGKLVSGAGAAVPDAVVLFRGDTIIAAGSRATVPVPAGAQVLDVSGLTILPGLVDGHVHLGAGAFVGNPTPVHGLLRSALDHGVTAVVDLGNAHPGIIHLRDSVARGVIEGPRILAAGAMITAPGGHPAGTWLRASPEAAALGSRQVSTPDSARAAVRTLVAEGVDVIKAVFDGGSERSPFGLLPRLDAAALAATIAAAKEAGRPAYVHAQQSADLAQVLAARPDVLVHLPVSPLADSLVQAIAAAGATVQPTSVVFASVLPAQIFERMYLRNIGALARANVRLIAGTDAPLSGAVGETLVRELELFVQAGLTPAQALATATTNAAAAAGRSDLGHITPGARADLLVVQGDPTSDIAALRAIRFVIAAGRIVRRSGP